MTAPAEHKRHAPATQRNREPIRDVLRGVLPTSGNVLEIGAGSGEHAVYLAAAFPGLDWQPSDVDPANLASIAAWAEETPLDNLRAPIALDVRRVPWRGVHSESIDAVICVNVIHIAPWEACEGLLAGAAQALRPGGALILYGPFMRDGRHTAPSNAAFDRDLRATDPSFGVRDLGQVAAQARLSGLNFETDVEMPANNLIVVFRRGADLLP